MAEWSFLTNHARALLFIAADPDAALLKSIAADLDVTERTAYGIVADLVRDGYIVKQKDGRRNRYSVQGHLPLPDPLGKSLTIGEVLVLLTDIYDR